MGLDSLFIKCLAYFYLGGLSALALKASQKFKKENFLMYLAFSSLIVLSSFCYIFEMYYHDFFRKFILFIFMPIILIIFSQNLLIFFKFKKILELLGNLSYAIYLIHFPIQLMIVNFYRYINKAIP